VTMQLRPYQVGAIDALRARVSAGVRRVLLCAPTGSGKTVMASEVIRGAVARGKRVVFVAHRKELIDQAFDKLCRFGVSAGVIMAGDKRRDDYWPVQVCSIQTLARRMDRLPPADVVVIDEAHHAVSNSYKFLVERYERAIVLGLTATPWRLGKLSLADMFEELVLAATPAELMAMGALVQYDAFAYDAPDLHDVKTVAGDWNQRELALACNTTVLVGSVAHEYVTHARGRRAILFPVDINHSRSIIGELEAVGVRAKHLDCHTPKLERERILADLASGAVQVVSSVGVLTEGFDCPEAEVCIIARPTQSLTLHLQILGRVLRTAPGKVRALIHDHAGNLMRHGFPDDDRDYSLVATPTRDRAMHTCPFCKFLFGSIRSDGCCPKCGELIAQALERRGGEGAEPRAQKVVVDGKRLSAAQIREARAMRDRKELRNDLSDADLVRVAHATPEEKAAEYLRLHEVRERKGFKLGWVAHQYRSTFGVWPKFSDEMLERTRPAVSPFIPLPAKPREEAA